MDARAVRSHRDERPALRPSCAARSGIRLGRGLPRALWRPHRRRAPAGAVAERRLRQFPCGVLATAPLVVPRVAVPPLRHVTCRRAGGKPRGARRCSGSRICGGAPARGPRREGSTDGINANTRWPDRRGRDPRRRRRTRHGAAGDARAPRTLLPARRVRALHAHERGPREGPGMDRPRPERLRHLPDEVQLRGGAGPRPRLRLRARRGMARSGAGSPGSPRHAPRAAPGARYAVRAARALVRLSDEGHRDLSVANQQAEWAEPSERRRPALLPHGPPLARRFLADAHVLAARARLDLPPGAATG